ncbi:MAG: PAS domain S-box protein [Actinobacteria bacterium]|nr:PAS domain S-box protein [Actinomycetota bacterium]
MAGKPVNAMPVLVIEDDRNQASLISTFIEEHYDAYTTVAGSCYSARELLKTDVFELIILDYQLPDCSGLEMLREITVVDDHPLVIMVTGQGSEWTAVDSFKYGAESYVIKGPDMSLMLSEALDKSMKMIALRKGSQLLEETRDSLQSSKEMWRSLIETSPVGILMSDLQGNILTVSPATAELHGYENGDELLGMNAFDLIAPEDRERTHENSHETLETSLLKNEECIFLKKDGSTFPGLLSAGLIRDKSGDPYAIMAVTIDITEKKNADNEIRQISRQLIKEQEEARVRLAADLHDEISQSLSVLKMNLSSMQLKDSTEIKEMEESRAILGKTMDNIRSICYELRPPELETLGLKTALGDYLEDFSGKTGIAVNFECDSAIDVPDDTAIQLFRVVQESLKNVEKHAETNSAAVSLHACEGNILLTLEDHGRGFETSGENKHKFGLWEMRERMLMVGGELAIDSRVGEGTLIRAKVPSFRSRQAPGIFQALFPPGITI